MMRTSGSFVLGGALLLALAAPAQGQDQGWQDLWFWGTQVGLTAYKTPTTGGTQLAITAGAHWLITGKRSGLFLAYDQIIYPNGPVDATSRINDPGSATGTRDVQFDNGRFIQADLVAIPLNGHLQVLVGAGVLLHQISDPVPMGTFASPADQAASQSLVNDAAMRAFGNLLASFQLRFGSRFAFFGTYRFIPSASGFLITAEQHSLTSGFRIALSSRTEEVSAQN
jgi:hypothetical protein